MHILTCVYIYMSSNKATDVIYKLCIECGGKKLVIRENLYAAKRKEEESNKKKKKEIPIPS